MAILLTNPALSVASEGLPHKTWTRPEVEILESAGRFAGHHYELIDGELIAKMGKERKHVLRLKETVMALEDVFGRDHVNSEAPIDVALEDNLRNEPEPDVTVLRRRSREIEGNPRPEDIALAMEISGSTLRHDLRAKASLYARAGMPEYWVLDVNARRLHVLREPSGGIYQTHFEVEETDSVTPLTSSTSIAVASLLA